jgi:hypothetical protein
MATGDFNGDGKLDLAVANGSNSVSVMTNNTSSPAVPAQAALTVATTGDGAGTVTSSPDGIDCGADCSELYPSGTTVTLTAVPADNSLFTGWSGCDAVDGASCTVTLDTARSVVAGFDLRRFALTVTKSRIGRGTVTSNPDGIACGSDCTEPSGRLWRASSESHLAAGSCRALPGKSTHLTAATSR